jgi:hypothetical protein
VLLIVPFPWTFFASSIFSRRSYFRCRSFIQILSEMGVEASELLVPFAGAIQASISVLITILFGVVAAQCNLLSVNAAKEVSKLCVRMFLPALLIYKIGSNLHQDTGVRYVPVLSKLLPQSFPTELLICRSVRADYIQYGL